MLYFIRLKIIQGHLSLDQIIFFGNDLWGHSKRFLLLLPIILVAVNWGLEARKWQILAAPIVSLTLLQATRAVLTGLSLAFITPRSIGDYAGRILECPVNTREALVGAVLLNRVSQSLVTYMAGLGGLLYLFMNHTLDNHAMWHWLSPLLLAATIGSGFMLVKGRFLLLKWGGGFATLKPLLNFLNIIGLYSSQEINRLVGLAFFRYCVFSFQFVLVLWLTGVFLPVQVLLTGVAVVFMLKSVIPAFSFLSDLGVREFSALLVFSVYAVPESQLILASLLVWCLNILIPTLIGGVNILRFRLNPPLC